MQQQIDHLVPKSEASQVATVVKNLLAMQEMEKTQVQPLGWEDSLE